MTSTGTARDVIDVVSLDSPKPAPRLIVDRPQPGPLSSGSLVVQYRVGDLQLLPVLAADDHIPRSRAGHMQFCVDDLPWHWADASGEPLIVHGLPPGPHRVRLTLVDPEHMPIAAEELRFVIPEPGHAARS